MELSQLVYQVIDIATGAGTIIMDVYDNSASFQVETKADESPLTMADRKANDHICNALTKLEVQYPIISEENKAIPFMERKLFDRCWLVDPLDGTKEFIKRNGEFTVNIALLEANQPILGVVYAPAMDKMYWAVKGKGAFREDGGKAIQLQASKFKLDDSNLKIVCSRSHINEPTKAYIEQFAQPELVATGSSLKFTILAEAAAEVYPRLAPTMEWDTGAAQIILEEAGGRVLDATTREPLRYNKEDLLNPHFIAFGNLS